MTIAELTERINDTFSLELKYTALRRHITRQMTSTSGFMNQYFEGSFDYGKNDDLPQDVITYFFKKYSDEESPDKDKGKNLTSVDGVGVKFNTDIDPRESHHPLIDQAIHTATDPQPEDYLPFDPPIEDPEPDPKEDPADAIDAINQKESNLFSYDENSMLHQARIDAYKRPVVKKELIEKARQSIGHQIEYPVNKELSDAITENFPHSNTRTSTIKEDPVRRRNIDLAEVLLSSKNIMTVFIIAALIFQAHIFSNLQLRVLAESSVKLTYLQGLLMGFLFDASGVFLAKNLKAFVKLPYDDRLDPRNVWIFIFFVFQVLIDLSYVEKLGSWSNDIGAILVALTVPLTLASFSSLVLKDKKNV